MRDANEAGVERNLVMAKRQLLYLYHVINLRLKRRDGLRL